MIRAVPFAFWSAPAAVVAPTALRWDWNAGTLTNDTGTGSDTWVDQDTTDGQANDLAINWDYTPVSPAVAPTLVLGDWLVGHPRAFQGIGFMFGDFVTPVGILDIDAYMEFRISGAPETGFNALIQLFSIECFDEQNAEMMLSIDDAGVCTAWVRLDSGTVQLYGFPVSISQDTIVKLGLKIEADGLNTIFTVLVDNIPEDTFSVVTSTIGTGVRQQIEGRATIGMSDESASYAPDLALTLFRYKLITL